MTAPFRRIATEEAFSIPEVYDALRGWAAFADPGEPEDASLVRGDDARLRR